MTHWIHPGAEQELGEAALYLAEHASPRIAQAFLLEYERVRDILVQNQQVGPHGDHGMRLYHFDRFPYTLIYEQDPLRGPQIFAVAHQSREPGYWASRL